jgi:CheY-like chemotaxis protein
MSATPTVLVVDDNAADRELIQRMLEPHFRFLHANDVASGLATFRREHPDCVLLDHHMPGVDGLDGLIELVKERAVVIMISTSSHEELAAEAIRRGARDFIPKDSLTASVLRRMILREHERRVLEQELRLAHKLEAIGQLAAGVAHEINTPAQYVSDNLTFLAEGFRDLLPILEACVDLARRDGADATALRQLVRKADIAFLTAELPSVLEQSAASARSGRSCKR